MCVNDVFSKYVWGVPLKDKEIISKEFKNILDYSGCKQHKNRWTKVVDFTTDHWSYDQKTVVLNFIQQVINVNL